MVLRERMKLFFKGMAMGAADVVPGVSGGTIAFISGIYEELLASIKAIGPDTISVLRRQGLVAAWRQFNGDFLITLVAGIITSVILLVRPITWALQNQPVMIWAFFFGLIAANVWLCGRLVEKWSAVPGLGLFIGTVVAVMIGLMRAAPVADDLIFFFFSGSIAICAMILPGISGSFILLLLGAYAPVMAAIKAPDVTIILVFGVGCLAGLMAFSRVLSWLFLRHHDVAVSTLTGFLLGSLTIVWPWKEVVSVRVAHEGRADEHLVPFIQANVWPAEYAAVTPNDMLLGITTKEPHLAAAVALMIAGAGLLVLLERLGQGRT
jgi:putative membrane protein